VPRLAQNREILRSEPWVPAFAGMSGLVWGPERRTIRERAGVLHLLPGLLASRRYGTLYCGHTDDLTNRMRQHKEGRFDGFTKRYGVTTLVWYEMHPARELAFRAERQIKKWRRDWKINLIEELNPWWEDLTVRIVQ